MKQKLSFYQLFWIFFIACCFGWVVEVLYDFFVLSGEFRNHSALIYGPMDVAYGIGAVLIALALNRYSKSGIIKIFVVSFLIGTVGEYIMSWGMEVVLGFTAWDYSNYFLNINGRVCFWFSFFWGLLGIAWVKWIMPGLNKLINKIPKKIGKVAMYSLIVLFVLDIFISYTAVSRQNRRANELEARNSFEKFLDKYYTDEFLEKVYPGIQEVNK